MQPLSPLDGRYRSQVQDLGEHLSEAGLNRARIQVEVEWLIWLTEHNLLGNSASLSNQEILQLRALAGAEFGDQTVAELAKTEAVTRHDVKAVEYFLRDALTKLGREDLHELVHFGCTSEDINNLAYAITISESVRKVWLPRAQLLVAKLKVLG